MKLRFNDREAAKKLKEKDEEKDKVKFKWKDIYEDNDYAKKEDQRFSDDDNNFHNFATVVNRAFELHGKKVNMDVANAIATRIMRDGFTIDQLENAARLMSNHRFMQLGYPEFRQYLPTHPAEKEKYFCQKCGEQMEENGKFIARGVLVSLCVKKDALRGFSVGETRILCNCDMGKQSHKFWASMPMYDDKNIFKAGGKWFFVFPMNDDFWFDRKWKIREYINENLSAIANINSDETREIFEGFWKRAENELAKKKDDKPQQKIINFLPSFKKISDDDLLI